MLTKKTADTAPLEKPEYRPRPSMWHMFEDMERMFSDMRLGFGMPSLWRFAGPSMVDWSPQVEVLEKPGEWKVNVDLPGLTANDVKVEFRERDLVIEGERKVEHEEKSDEVYRSERAYGTFFRAFSVPEGAKVDQAKAVFVDGVLSVVIPVAERPVPQVRRLEIADGVKKGGKAA